MNLATICDATQDQFINDATIVGRLGNDPKASDSGKSVSNSIAVNRWLGKDNKLTDWFKIRGWGYNGEKLQEKFPKGSLVAVNGMIEARRTRQDKLYPELKIRNLTIHASGKEVVLLIHLRKVQQVVTTTINSLVKVQSATCLNHLLGVNSWDFFLLITNLLLILLRIQVAKTTINFIHLAKS